MSTKDAPRAVSSSAEERSQGRYNTPNLQYALEGLHQDGLLVLKNIVDVQHVDHLREVMGAQTQSIIRDSPRAGLFNQGVQSNILQNPPLDREDCLYNDVWFNPMVVQIANA